MPYPIFDTSQLNLQPISNRINNLTLKDIIPLDAKPPDVQFNNLDKVAHEIILARKKGAPVILFMGAHVLRRGNSRFIISLMEKGLVTHLAVNGAFAIHDFEFSLIGATTESVEKYIAEGQFGLWAETGQINEFVLKGNSMGLGLGESIGKYIFEEDFPHRDISIFTTAYKNKIPITVHVSIGQDIIHEHPNFNGASFGESSYRDFLIFTQALLSLEGGVFLNYGSAVTGPEVYLKALSMVRNVAIQQGKAIKNFTTAVFDLVYLGEDYHRESPKENARYYFRPYKTILVRTVKDGGKSFYIRGDHGLTFPALYRLLMDEKR
jgi:hypothetical protein